MVSFCHVPGATLSTLLKDALGAADTLVVIEVDRESTAAASLQKLFESLEVATLAGSVVEGRPTPVAGTILCMRRVGVVVRDMAGIRIYSPDGDGRPPDLWVPVNDPHNMVASWGNDAIATLAHRA